MNREFDDRTVFFHAKENMTLNDYQDAASKTTIYPNRGTYMGLIYTALKGAGEAGEFSEKVAKMLRDDSGLLSEDRRWALVMEASDILWYVSQMAHELGVTLDHVARLNIEKLGRRALSNKLHGSGDNR